MCLSSFPAVLFLVYFAVGAAIGYCMSTWGLSRLWSSAKHTTTALALEEMKMVLVVRKDLKMGAGKVAAQCAHAAVASVEMLTELDRHSGSEGHPWIPWFQAWRHSGYAKVALQCPDEAELMNIAKLAKAKGLPYSVIRDAGRTQIAAGSKTVVAVGPGPKSIVDTVTGHLKLL